jgi:hypothetical protein
LRILGRSCLFVILPILAGYVVFSPVRVVQVETAPVTLTIFGRSFEGTHTRTQYEWNLGLPTLAVWAGAACLLFARANRRNGWLALHDWLTGTRVVSPATHEPRCHHHCEFESHPLTGTPMLGPFHILEAMPGCDDWLIGFDPKLLRKVWLRKLPPGTAPVSAALRNLRRLGRLRWLAGIRSPEENWDAYEFPGGHPLCSRIPPAPCGEGVPPAPTPTPLTSPRIPWHQLRPWLADLAAELTAAAADGTQPATPGIEQVWITAAGRAKLLDFPAPGVQQNASTGDRSLWLDLTENVLDRRALSLPVSVFLDNLPQFQDPAALTRELAHLAGVPHAVSRAKRLGIIAASAAGPLLIGTTLLLLKSVTLAGALFWAFAALIVFVALPAITAAALAGDGLILRTVGTCVVARDGKPAAGVLASRRSLIAWLPTLTSPALFATLMLWMNPSAAAAVTFAALGLLALVSAIFPGNSLHDRLAGTCLVPR